MNYTIANIVITQTSDYMDEYIEHYKSLGFTKIYIGCTTQSAFEELSKLDDEFIEVINYINEYNVAIKCDNFLFSTQIQIPFYKYIILSDKYNIISKYDFITTFDNDEFLECVHDDLQYFLHKIYNKNDIVLIPWNNVSCNGVIYEKDYIGYKQLKNSIKPPKLPMLCVSKFIFNTHIIKKEYIEKFDSVHYLCASLWSKIRVPGRGVYIDNCDVYLNHLQTRTLQTFCKCKLSTAYYNNVNNYNYKTFNYFFNWFNRAYFNVSFIKAYEEFVDKSRLNILWSTNINYTHLKQQLNNREKNNILDAVGFTAISCLMPVGNVKAEYLKESIQSILNQSYKFFELIICNDWPDNTTTDDVVKSFNDKRIIYIKNEKNLGVAATRNKLKSLAIGEYVAIMDADDIADKYRFEKEVDFLQKNQDIDLVSSYVSMPTGEWYMKHTKTSEEISTCLLLGGNTISNQAAMFRQKPFENIWYDESLKTCDDFDFWITAIEQGCKFAIIPENLVTYRLQETSISNKIEQNIKDTNYIVKKHISKVVDLSKYKSDVIENFRGCGYIKRKVYKWELDELNDLIDKLVNAYDVDINWVNRYVRSGPMFKKENILTEAHQQLYNTFLI